MKFALSINLNILAFIAVICIMLGLSNEGITRIFMFSYWMWMVFNFGMAIIAMLFFCILALRNKSHNDDIKKSVEDAIKIDKKRIVWRIFNRLIIIATIGVLLYIGYTFTAVFAFVTLILTYQTSKFFTTIYK